MEMEGGEKTRIFVGGLGESVTSDDLRKVFASYGGIEALDIIRTKGRSFAYLDFSPSSDKSLPKLFSTYNGCVWKGARLRLEKAKEDYLTSLKREWAEDVQVEVDKSTNAIDGDKNTNFGEKLRKCPELEKKQLHFFFPKLGKVKSLPFSGTGKHKYSFKRVEVPSLPMYFCDCEEHSGIPQSAEERRNSELDVHSGVLNEEELNIMDSVMDKLFARESLKKNVLSGNELIDQGEHSVKMNGAQRLDDNEVYSSAEDDNLILNVVMRAANRVGSSDSQKQETFLDNQKARFNKKRHSKDDPTHNEHKIQKRRTLPANKERKSLHKEIDGDQYTCAIPGGKSNLLTQTNGSLKLLNTSPTEKRISSLHEKADKFGSTVLEEEENLQNHSSGSKEIMEAQPVEHQSGVKSSTNLSWSENHSVSDGGKSAFSVSHLLPGNSSLNEKQLISDDILYSTEKQILERNEKPQLQSENREVEDLGQTGKLVAVKGLADTQTSQPSAEWNKSGRGAAWCNKKSWTQLIGESKSSSFSITQLVPAITFTKQEPKTLGNMGAVNSNGSTASNLANEDTNEHARKGSIAPAVVKEGDDVTSTLVKDQRVPAHENKASASKVGKPHNFVPKQTSAVDVSIGETCLFMRSDASLKEWAKAKAAISGSRKRRGNNK
ncbi:hypothetical protein HS088_TW23G00528 [Tripterygium wilfordii]|uniref:RRM domain-containing protein n=1 Tax=Tripterygium wilfordii TaxID=458696 RepID=A0A7J7BV91_TRIWF|nr:uncharacterized protein LOC119993374 [Tripterygium wilfordii]KAF5725799.1 hypothetical protein HS088_TW23G00528 [Tripterygium wilfordii]